MPPKGRGAPTRNRRGNASKGGKGQAPQHVPPQGWQDQGYAESPNAAQWQRDRAYTAMPRGVGSPNMCADGSQNQYVDPNGFTPQYAAGSPPGHYWPWPGAGAGGYPLVAAGPAAAGAVLAAAPMEPMRYENVQVKNTFIDVRDPNQVNAHADAWRKRHTCPWEHLPDRPPPAGSPYVHYPSMILHQSQLPVALGQMDMEGMVPPNRISGRSDSLFCLGPGERSRQSSMASTNTAGVDYRNRSPTLGPDSPPGWAPDSDPGSGVSTNAPSSGVPSCPPAFPPMASIGCDDMRVQVKNTFIDVQTMEPDPDHELKRHSAPWQLDRSPPAGSPYVHYPSMLVTHGAKQGLVNAGRGYESSLFDFPEVFQRGQQQASPQQFGGNGGLAGKHSGKDNGNGSHMPATGAWQIIWCDERAFKQTSEGLKAQLEAELHTTVKAHKSAEKCIRSLQKKVKGDQRNRQIIVLTSIANAPTLIPYVAEVPAVSNCIVFVDAHAVQQAKESLLDWVRGFPFVSAVTTTWEETLDAVKRAAGQAVAPLNTGLYQVNPS